MENSHQNPHHEVILHTAGLSAAIVLAEPSIFLSGFSKQEQQECTPALVRGSLILQITKPKKLKSITLNFNGVSRTEWPEGIPSEKSETHETKDVFKHEWRLFSVHQKNAATSSGAHSVIALDSENLIDNNSSSNHGNHHHTEHNSHSTSIAPSASHTLVNQQESISKGYRVFNPAEYIYNFELILPHTVPETIKCNFGTIRWGFNLEIDRHGKFKPKLNAYKEVQLLRTLGPSNLESSEPIVINRDWEDLLHYEITIAGKAFAIGQKFNMNISLVRLSKVKCHRIRLYITEHTEYFCRNNRIHRVEPSHKFLLMEHKSIEGSRGDLLEERTEESGIVDFDFNVEIPTNFPSRRDYLRPNASTESIKVYHWIKVVMRLSRQDRNSPSENKCYEVSIDSPITLVDAQTLLHNELPNYNAVQYRKRSMVDVLKPYEKFIQDTTPLTAGGRFAQQSNIYLRKPSIAPPPFDLVEKATIPPPQYDENTEKSYRARYETYLRSKIPRKLNTPDLDISQQETTSKRDTSPDSQTAEEPYQQILRFHNENFADSESTSQNSDQGSSSTTATQPEEEFANSKDIEPNEFSVFSEIFWREGGEDPEEGDEPDAVGPRDNSTVMTPVRAPAEGLHRDSENDPYADAPSSTLQSKLSAQLNSENNNKTMSEDEQTDKETSDKIVEPEHASSHNRNETTTESVPVSPRFPEVTDSSGSPWNSNTQDTETPPVPVIGLSPAQTPVHGSTPVTPSDGRASPRGGYRTGSLTHRNSIQVQRLRNSIGSTGSSLSIPSSPVPPNSVGNISSRQTTVSSRKLSLKSASPAMTSTVLPRSPANTWAENATQLFGERWLDRRESMSSITSNSPRYFRQSSVVSIDLTRQGEIGSRDSRRPSRVSEVQEAREWYPLSRNNSTSSAAVSIAEYQLADRQSSPLLGDDNSEIDIGLEWDNDFEDYHTLENDRRSVVSAFYTVMTP